VFPVPLDSMLFVKRKSYKGLVGCSSQENLGAKGFSAECKNGIMRAKDREEA
jgi:hypothetical protein